MSVLKLPARIPACIYMGEFEDSDQLSYRVEVPLTWNDSCRIGGRSCQPSVPRTPQSVSPCGIHSDVMGESVTMATQDHKLCVCVCSQSKANISLPVHFWLQQRHLLGRRAQKQGLWAHSRTPMTLSFPSFQLSPSLCVPRHPPAKFL